MNAGRRAMLPMGRLIQLQIVRDQGVGQRDGLPKSQAHAFAGDGIHGTRGVANEHSASSIDALQAARDRDCTALFTEGACAFEPTRQLGEESEGSVHALVRIAREHGGAHFVGPNASDIHLAARAPINLHEIGPGADAIMTPESVAQRFAAHGIEIGPATNARVLSVRADDPTGAHFSKPCHVSSPQELYTQFLSAIDQELMQAYAPDRDPAVSREIRGHRTAGASETDPAKGERLLGIERDAQLAQRFERIRH